MRLRTKAGEEPVLRVDVPQWQVIRKSPVVEDALSPPRTGA